jgi:cytidine deaminase
VHASDMKTVSPPRDISAMRAPAHQDTIGMPRPHVPPSVQARMSEVAWAARERARLHGPTAVGCAALGTSGIIVGGCNVEHRYRSHDIHAEVNAIGSLVAADAGALRAVLIAAERNNFTPCGACLDWVFEVGGPDTEVGWQSRPDEQVRWAMAETLMPRYPS